MIELWTMDAGALWVLETSHLRVAIEPRNAYGIDSGFQFLLDGPAKHVQSSTVLDREAGAYRVGHCGRKGPQRCVAEGAAAGRQGGVQLLLNEVDVFP